MEWDPFLFLTLLMNVTTTKAITTLFVGDSDIEFWETDSIFTNSANVGVAGFTCAQVNNNINKYLSDYPSAEWIVLVCGENDLWSQSASETFEDFMKVVNKIVEDGSRRVVYMGTKPEPSTKRLHEKYRCYDEQIRNQATEMAQSSSTGIPPLIMVDVYPVFDEIENEEPGELYRNDRLHLSSYGYDFWNIWAATAIGDEGTCIRWKDNQCSETIGTTPPTGKRSPLKKIKTFLNVFL